jgi:FAD/FMN-containing dehydrogenase
VNLGDDLRAIVGDAHVLTDDDLVAGHTTDWTGRFVGRTPAVVRPGSTEEVAAIVRWCAEHRIAVVPQGGNTGLVGGSVPLAGEVVLSTRRLATIADVDPIAGQVTVGAGATLEAVQRAVAAHGLEPAVDLAARGSATIGGMVATNAGGTRVLRHGPMRSQVAGVEAVLGTGEVVSHLGGLLKDNTGYDLAGLLTGSEGTLGIVTQVRLRLVPTPAERTVALLAVDTADDAVAAFVAARAGCPDLEAAELVFADGVDLVCAHLRMGEPFTGRHHGALLLLEAAAADDPTERLVEALGPAADRIADTAIATTSTRREELWRYREAHTESINALGVPHKLDVTLPLGRLAAFCDEVRATVEDAAPGARTFLFGHVGDGNVHVNVVGPPPDDDAVDGAVLRLVAERGGSISAEHGIGTAKRAHLHLGRSPAEIAAFRRIKAALDPAGILNPAVLLPPIEE